MARSRLMVVIAAWLALLAASASAETDVTRLAERLDSKAMGDYDSLEFDSARQTLLSAIAKLRDAGLDETPTAARCYLDLGIVYIAGFKDRNRGVQQFVNAVKVDPTIVLDAERATPELQEAFEEAVRQASSRRRGVDLSTGGGSTSDLPPRPITPKPAKHIQGLQHDPVEEAPARTELVVRVQTGSDLGVTKVLLFYRNPGRENYTSVSLVPERPGGWAGKIPASGMVGRTVQYYLEAHDGRGKRVANLGSAVDPIILTVIDKAGTEDKEDHPLAPGPTSAAALPGRGYGRLFVTLAGGVAMGVVPSSNWVDVAFQRAGDTTPMPVTNPGTVLEPLVTRLEVGYNFTRNLGLAAVARLGSTLGMNNAGGQNAASGDFAGMLRLRVQFGRERFHPFLHLGVGGGLIRHVFDLSSANTPQQPLQTYARTPACPAPTGSTGSAACWDSIQMGSLLLGLGLGASYDVWRFRNGGLAILLSIDATAAVPVLDSHTAATMQGDQYLTPYAVGDQLGFNIDYLLGLGVHFL